LAENGSTKKKRKRERFRIWLKNLVKAESEIKNKVGGAKKREAATKKKWAKSRHSKGFRSYNSKDGRGEKGHVQVSGGKEKLRKSKRTFKGGPDLGPSRGGVAVLLLERVGKKGQKRLPAVSSVNLTLRNKEARRRRPSLQNEGNVWGERRGLQCIFWDPHYNGRLGEKGWWGPNSRDRKGRPKLKKRKGEKTRRGVPIRKQS